MKKTAIVLCTLTSLHLPARAQDMLTAKLHATQGLAAAETFPGYASLCDLEARIRNVNVPRDRSSRPQSANRLDRGGNRNTQRPERTKIPATQVFDNLWFLGSESVTSWLYGTPEGFILIDGLNNDEEAQELIFDGMLSAGLDPKAIQMVLVTHGHGDHYGGADYVAEQLGVDVLMTELDWELVSRIGIHPRFGPPPTKGGVITDGQILRAGTSEMTVHWTPGHTPGTVSPSFEVYDGSKTHKAFLWGGTGFNFGQFEPIFRAYAASARKAGKIAKAEGVDVFISGHPRRDGAIPMLNALETRGLDEPHPFVKGAEGYALFELLEECALAQAARFAEN